MCMCVCGVCVCVCVRLVGCGCRRETAHKQRGARLRHRGLDWRRSLRCWHVVWTHRVCRHMCALALCVCVCVCVCVCMCACVFSASAKSGFVTDNFSRAQMYFPVLINPWAKLQAAFVRYSERLLRHTHAHTHTHTHTHTHRDTHRDSIIYMHSPPVKTSVWATPCVTFLTGRWVWHDKHGYMH